MRQQHARGHLLIQESVRLELVRRQLAGLRKHSREARVAEVRTVEYGVSAAVEHVPLRVEVHAESHGKQANLHREPPPCWVSVVLRKEGVGVVLLVRLEQQQGAAAEGSRELGRQAGFADADQALGDDDAMLHDVLL